MDVSPRTQAGGTERPAGGLRRGAVRARDTSSCGQAGGLSGASGPSTREAGWQSEGMSHEEKLLGFKEQHLVGAGLQSPVEGLVGGFAVSEPIMSPGDRACSALSSFELEADDRRRVASLLGRSPGLAGRTDPAESA